MIMIVVVVVVVDTRQRAEDHSTSYERHMRAGGTNSIIGNSSSSRSGSPNDHNNT